MTQNRRRLPYRVIYNQDCTNLFAVTKDCMTSTHVDRMVDEVAEGGADLMLINPQAMRANYPSRVWQTFWDGYTPGDRSFFGNVPADTIPRREHMVQQMKRLADQGIDYVAHSLARCRQQGIAGGVSVRMNDSHDTPYGQSNMLTDFYLEHPNYHLPLPYRPSGPYTTVTVLDYRRTEVRDHFLALIRELVVEYEPEVLELDFLRFPGVFPEGQGAAYAQVLSDFVGEVASLIHGNAQPVHLLVRLPSTPALAVDLGLDAPTWVAEGWVDAISVGGQFCTSWQSDLSGYRRWVGDRCTVYAHADSAAAWPDGIEPPTSHRSTTSEWVMGTNPDLLRGFAAACYAQGADGIYVFNLFTTREWRKGDPSFTTLGELASPEQLRGSQRTHLLANAGTLRRNPNADPPTQLPLVVETRQARSLSLLAAAGDAGETAELGVVVQTQTDVKARDFLAHLNGCSLGRASQVAPVTDAQDAERVREITFTVRATMLRDGRNDIAFRNDGNAVTLVAIRLRVN